MPQIHSGISVVLFLTFTVFLADATPRRLNPECRSNVCDDRPVCPRTSCRCLFASRMDCAVYYQCVDGKPNQYRCSPGLLFNEDTLSCDYSHNVLCNLSSTTAGVINTTTATFFTTPAAEIITTITTEEESTTVKTQPDISTVTSSITETKEQPITTEITEKPTTTEITQQPTTTGKTTTGKTTTGKPATEMTEQITTTETSERQSSTTEKITETTKAETEKESTTSEKSTSTDETSESHITTTVTPETGSTFTTEESSTESPISKSITDKVITAKTTETGGITQDTSTETATVITTLKTEDLTTTKIMTTTILTTEVLPTSNSSESSTFNSSDIDNISTTVIPNSTFECPTRFGLFPDPKSCNRFYHCSHWTSYHKWCPSNLHFNPTLKVCDWPYRAGCDSNSTTSSEPVNTTSVTFLTTPAAKITTTITTEEESTSDKTPAGTSTVNSSISYTTEQTKERLTTTEMTEKPTTKVTKQPTTIEITKQPTTTEVTKQPTTTEVAKQPTTTEVTKQPTTTEVTKQPTTTEKITETTENPTTEITEQVTTTETTEQVTTTETSEGQHFTTNKITESTINTVSEIARETTTDEKRIETSTTEGTETSTSEGTETSTSEGTETSTTERPETSTIERAEASTTERVETSSTERPVTSTTERAETSTIERIEASTTERVETSTTQRPKTSTTERAESSTIERIESSTTEKIETTTSKKEKENTTTENSDVVPISTEETSESHITTTVIPETVSSVITVESTTENPITKLITDKVITAKTTETVITKDTSTEAASVITRSKTEDLTTNKVMTTTVLTTKVLPSSSSSESSTFTSSDIDNISTIVTPSTFKCPSRFGLFPDPKSCNRFYHCSHWTPYHKWCPSDLHFNPTLKVCDWPYRAGCDSVSPTTLEPETTPATSNSNNTNITCDCDYCELPIPGDCTAYVLCIDRAAYKMHCGPDLYFNSMTGTCDFKENVDCIDDGPICIGQSGRYQLEESCSYFVECHGKNKTMRTCPEGLQFSQSTEMCSWTGSCSGEKPVASNSSKIIVDFSICQGCSYCFKANETDCARYVRCFQGTATAERCAPGLFFNPATELCDHDYNVQCPEPQPQPECTEMYGYFPYPGECGMYMQCITGEAIAKKCPGVLHFDPVKKHCDWPWAAGCSDPDPNPTPIPSTNNTKCDCDCCLKPYGNDCQSFELCVNQVGFIKSCSSGLRFNPETENCDFAEKVDCVIPSDVPSYQCPEHQGLFPHPEDCKKFIHCSHGFPYVKDCPSHLHFNPKLKVCDWPYSADCQSFQPTERPTDEHDLPCDICDSCFIPDETDCSSYTFCHNGTGHRLRCTENLVFNPEINACDYPSNVKCPNQPTFQCLKPDGFFTAKECSQYIRCSNGIAYLEDCPKGLHFNPVQLVCDLPEVSNCGQIPAQPTPPDDDDDKEGTNRTCNCDCCFLPHETDCSKYILCLDNYAYVGHCSRGLLFSPSIQNCDFAERVTCGESSPLCPQPNGLFPNTKQCSSYIKCSSGSPEIEYCQNGLHFSAEKRQCTDPCKANCDSSYNCNSTFPTSSSTTLVSTSTSLSPCYENDGLFPNKDDCTSFYQCSEGTPYLVICPSGLHFSYEHQICDYPCDAKCNSSIDCSPPEPSSSTTSTKFIASSTSSVPLFCPESDGAFPNKDNCSTFYLCSKGKPYLINCPGDLHFSSEHQVCDYPCNAKCNVSIDCNSTTPIPTQSSAITSSGALSPFCPQSDGFFPNKDNCSTFYKCSGGKAYLISCPSGLHFNSENLVCAYPCEAKCNKSIDCSLTTPDMLSSTILPHCPEADGLYPVHNDCSAFYLCSDGKEHLVHCPPGLHYSEAYEICEAPCSALCNKSLDCSTSEKPVYSTPHSLSPECETADGLFTNPEDCGSFYQCKNGQSHLMRCPSGLHFSEDDSACEKPCVAGCDMSKDCPPEIPETKGNCTCDDCYLSDPNDCSAFYFCDHGELTKGYCPFGTLFSKVTKICEDEDIVDCEANGDPSMCPEPYGFFPYPGDCKKFVHCDNGVAHVQKCQTELEYDPENKVCSKPKGYCADTILDPNCPEPTGLFPNPKNCSIFYHCEHGVAFTKRCSPPLMFNPEKEVCDWPENVQCGKVSSTATTASSISSTAQSLNISTTAVTTSIPASPPSSECHEVPGVICPCACRVPTYEECSSYFQCREDGTACKKYCPDGLYFNKREMVCDLPENVECRDFFFTYLRRAKYMSHHISNHI